MRYFEIVRPSPRHILSDTGLKEPTAGERRIDGMKSAGSLKGRVAMEPINLPIGSHVGGIYRPGVRNSAGEFPSSQSIAADLLLYNSTDDFRCLLPLFV